MTPQKNILAYIDAVKEVMDQGYKIKIDWYGYADQGGLYFALCQEKIKELGLEGVFEFHLPSENVVALYQGTDAFCLPSLYEGTPNVVCEAMSCGVPILCSDVCDNGLYVKGNGLLFDPYDKDDIVSKIITFIDMPSAEKQTMREMSRKLAMEIFSSEAFVKRYIDIIQDNV